MHRQIDCATEERFFNLLGEQPLGSDLGKSDVRDFVPGGVDDFDPALGAEALETCLYPARLPKSELRAPRADGQHSSRLAGTPFEWQRPPVVRPVHWPAGAVPKSARERFC